jgi:hypothetical protein
LPAEGNEAENDCAAAEPPRNLVHGAVAADRGDQRWRLSAGAQAEGDLGGVAWPLGKDGLACDIFRFKRLLDLRPFATQGSFPAGGFTMATMCNSVAIWSCH